ncbi:MAG: iron-sulfur cluster assembly accessory protein [Gammaproteobacteria bacterium]|nr:iron-sulfur cluster assembly accessory protein [Gammaproteobacteria bacterium]
MGAIEYPTRISDTEMRLTPAAQAKFAEMLAEADNEITGIRVFVSGGGCGGMTYDMTYADHSVDKNYDSVLEGPGFKVFVDPIALNYLQGCEIDFRNSSFVFNKVFQAVGGKGTCGGCGGGGGF